MKDAKEILETLWLLIKAGFVGLQILLDIPKKEAKRYLRGLKRLATIATIPSLVVAIIGITTGWLWLTACAGIWCTGCLIFLAIWGSPVGVLIAKVITDGKNEEEKKKLGARYLSLARGIILWETVTFCALSVIPIRNNWELVPLCVLTIACLVLMSFHWQRESKLLRPLLWYSAIVIVILCMIAFWFPNLTPMSAWGWTKSNVSNVNVGIESDTVTTILTYSAVIGLIALAIWFSIWLVRKLSHSHGGGGHGGHGGHGGGESHPLKTFAWVLLILWGIAVLVGTVRMLIAPDFKEQIWGKPTPSMSQQAALNEYKLGGSESIPLGEGNTLFTLSTPNQVCRMTMPTYRYDGWMHHGGNVYMMAKGNREWKLYAPDSLEFPGKDAEWIDVKSAESFPVDVTIFIRHL